MKKSLSNRLTAILLVICMMLSLIPGGFAADGTEGKDYVFDMGRLKYGQWSNEGKNPSDLTDWDVLESLKNPTGISTDPYMFYGQSEDVRWTWTSSSGEVVGGARGPEIYGKGGGWVGLIVRVDESGVYEPTVRYSGYKDQMPLSFYLAPLGASDPMSEQFLLGNSDQTSNEINRTTRSTYGNRYLAAGDYVWIGRISDDVTDVNYAYMGALFLKSVSVGASERLELSAELEDCDIDEEVPLTITATMDGEEIPLSELDILRIDSLNGDVASVRKDGDEYLVRGEWEGSTEIYLDAQIGDELTSITVPLTVTMPAGYQRIEIQAGTQPDAYFMNDPITVDLTYLSNRVETDISVNSITVEVADPNMAEAALDADKNLVITGRVAGATSVIVTAVVNGNEGKLTLPITIGGIKYHYNFMKAYYGPWSNSAYPVEQMTSFDLTTKGSPKEINCLSYKVTSDPWRYGGTGGMFNAQITSSFKDYGYLAGGGAGDWLCFQILVEDGGVYSLAAVVGKQIWGSAFEIYFSPEGTPESELIDEKYYMDYFLTEATGTSMDHTIPVGNVTIEPGIYNVVFRLKPDTLVGYGGMMSGVKLIAIEDDEFKLFTATPDPIMETASNDIPLTALWNGAEVDFSDVTDLAVVSADESIATAEVIHEGETASVRINGIASGQTKLTVTGKRGGKDATYTFNVDIAEKKRIYSISLDAEQHMVEANTAVPTTLTGVYYDGTPIDFEGLDIYYEVDNAQVARVDGSGVVRGIEKGDITVRAYVQQWGKHLLSAETVMAIGYSEITDVEFNVGDELKIGTTVTPAVTLKLASGLVVPSDQYTATITVESMEPANCAQVANGRMRGRAEGTVVLRADIEFDGKTTSVTKTVNIVKELSNVGGGDTETAVAAEEVRLDILKTLMSVGETSEATLGAYYTDGKLVEYTSENEDMTLTYNEEIVKYESGKFVAVAPGETEVTLVAGEIEKSVTVTVDEEVLGSASAEIAGTLYQGKEAVIDISAYTSGGRLIDDADLTISYVSANDTIASVSDAGRVTGLAVGETSITVTINLAGASVTAVVPVNVAENYANQIRLTSSLTVMKPDSAEGIQTAVSIVDASGDVKPADVSSVTFESLDPDILSVDGNGLVMPVGELGTGTIRATFVYEGNPLTADLEITVRKGKTESTYFTAERREAIRDNAEKYDWAEAQVRNSATMADPYIDHEDEILANMTTGELPRSIWTGLRNDPTYMNCNYCGDNIIASSGEHYPWLYDYDNYPWKLQCPTCRRRFPSNDFWAFYQTGIDEHGNWSYELAKQNGSHLLTNDMYPEKGEGWGVDDGYGYRNGETFETTGGTRDYADLYIAYYNHWANWYSTGKIYKAIMWTSHAYAYTGDPKYGRIAALFVDRVADLYPDMNTGDHPEFNNNGWFGGKIVGGIWETGVANMLSKAYDATFDLYDDPYVLGKIQEKAKKWNLETPKSNGAEVREHIENNLLREIKNACYDKRINGNSGMHQSVAVMAGVVLDNMPDSKEMIDWALTGFGATVQTIVGQVDRDGQGTEASPSYNNGWISQYSTIAEVLGGYKSYQEVNLYTNPKYLKMLKMNLPLTMTRNTTLAIGDTGGFATTGFHFSTGAIGQALVNGCDDPELAQILYFTNGNSFDLANARSLMVNTEELESKVERLIKEHGEYDFDKSTQMTSYGVGILRGGTYIKDNLRNTNTQRSAAIYYGAISGHGQHEALELMMDAYGLNVMPTMGYPTDTTGNNKSVNWESATVSHNTVVVNDVMQNDPWYAYGNPKHFDDSGRVKVVEGEATYVYTNQGVSDYRRTAVMVEVNDEDAYTLDFFRIKGGNSHTYSFHANSNEISDHNLNAVSQPMGTYAGPNVPFGPGVVKSGYDALYDVERAVYPGNEFMVEFKINDFRKVLKEDREIYLRMTQLNDFDLVDVSMATGNPPFTGNNPEEIKYVLARREGQNLDSLFATVIEPYDRERYIDTIEAVDIEYVSGSRVSEPAKAVKITLKDGRVDYVVYTSSDTTRYRIDDKFDFIGFVGVISYQDDEVVYRYMHDSTMIGGLYGDAEATGTVTDFTKGLKSDNSITVRLNKTRDVSELIGKTIFVNNGTTGKNNGAYWILDAVQNRDGTYTLDVGDVALVIAMDANGNYTYNIKEGQSFYIPLTTTDEARPIVEPIPEQAITVGDTLEIPIIAESPIGNELTYRVASATSGAAMVDNVLYFSPDRNQTGNVAILVEVSDGIRKTVANVIVTVYPSTSGSGSKPSAGGGGGGGGGGSAETEDVTFTDNGGNIFTGSDGSVLSAGSDKTPGTADDITNIVKNDDGSYSYTNADGETMAAGEDGLLGTADDVKVEGGSETTPVDPSEKFIDLGNHAWAKDAIYRLVDAGVIKGVSENKFAPANPITRADFATLLVRAWNLTSEEIGTFDDVAESDYYYETVGIASALGIVKGVGEGKFAPKAPITREQMMVMLCRTLTVVEAEIAEAAEDVLADYSDADQISEYAVESVKLMVGNGCIQGANGKINPQGNATRAEVAVLLDRILTK